MGSYRLARRQGRAQEFGRRHPRLTGVVVCIVLAGVSAVCAFQIRHGAYLGRGWVIATVAGIVTAAALNAAVLIRIMRHDPALGRLGIAWVVLALLAALSIRLPFPQGRYGSVQAFFDVVKAAALGYEAVTDAALIVLLADVLIRPGGLPGRLAPRQPPVGAPQPDMLPDAFVPLPRRQMARFHGWPGWLLAGTVAGLVAGITLAVAGGPQGHRPTSTVAGFVILLALATMCVAIPALLYRRYRSRRLGAGPPSLPGTSTVADPVEPGGWLGQDQAR